MKTTFSPSAFCLAIVMAGVSAQAAVTAVNWSGDYLSTSASLQGDQGAGAGVYQDPDSVGSGAGALAGRAYSIVTPFSPAAPYGTSTGVSATFYGGGVVQDVMGTGNDGFNELAVLNQGPTDSIHLQVTSSGSSQHTLDLLNLWLKQDFLNGTNTGAVDLSGDGYFHYNTSQAGGGHNDGSYTVRWVVMNGVGNQVYVSPTAPLGNNDSVTQLFSAISGWETYNVVEGDLTSLMFDGTSATYSTPSSALGDIRGFGFLIEHADPSGPVHTHIEHFEVGAAPEPSRALLTLLGAGVAVLRRRRKGAL